MKRITIEIPDGYDDAVTITAIGMSQIEQVGIGNVSANVAIQGSELNGHDGDVFVMRPNEKPEWRKPTTATWEWFEEHSGRSLYDDDDIIDLGWRCSHCKKPLEESVGGYWDEFDNKPDLKFCPECGEKMVV